MVLVMENLFFLVYVLPLERWAAYIAAGGGVAILVIAALVFPLKEPYSSATPTAMEPLVNPRFPTETGTGQTENYY